MALRYLFVYGTLRRDSTAPLARLLARRGRLVGAGWIRARLYELGGYPGAVPSRDPQARVHGELYRLQGGRGVLGRLDDYEECGSRYPRPREYRRMGLPVRRRGRPLLRAWVYVYARDVTGLAPIASGDYRPQLRGRR